MSRARFPATRLSDVLRHRDFRYLFLGITSSRFGDSMTFVVISWLALRAGGPRAVGLVMFSGGAVSAAAAPVIGYLLDRLGVRALMCADNLGRGALMLGLAGLAWSGPVRLEFLFVFAIAAALLSPATEVGQSVATPMLVRPGELDAVSRLLTSTWTVSASMGPALAGLVFSAAGPAPVLLMDAMTFFVMAGIALLMPGRPENAVTADSPGRARSSLLSGFRLLWQLRTVAMLTGIGVGLLFLDGMMEVFWSAFTGLKLHEGPAQYGVLVSIAGLASLAGTLFLAPLVSRLGPGSGLASVLAARALLVLPLAFAGSWAMGAILTGAASVPDGVSFPILQATNQRLIPASVRGRVQGARGALAAAGFPLGSALGGSLVASAGAGAAALVMASGYLLLSAAIVATPQLLRLRRTDDLQAA